MISLSTIAKHIKDQFKPFIPKFVKWIIGELGYKCSTHVIDFYSAEQRTLARAKWPQVQLKSVLYVFPAPWYEITSDMKNTHSSSLTICKTVSHCLHSAIHKHTGSLSCFFSLCLVLLFLFLCDSSSSCPQNMSLLS